MLIKDKMFADSIEYLDAKNYEGCTFSNCVMIYQGGPPPSLSGCNFLGSEFRFDGPALNTVHFLAAMKHPNSGLGHLFNLIFGIATETSDIEGPQNSDPVASASPDERGH